MKRKGVLYKVERFVRKTLLEANIYAYFQAVEAYKASLDLIKYAEDGFDRQLGEEHKQTNSRLMEQAWKRVYEQLGGCNQRYTMRDGKIVYVDNITAAKTERIRYV